MLLCTEMPPRLQANTYVRTLAESSGRLCTLLCRQPKWSHVQYMRRCRTLQEPMTGSCKIYSRSSICPAPVQALIVRLEVTAAAVRTLLTIFWFCAIAFLQTTHSFRCFCSLPGILKASYCIHLKKSMISGSSVVKTPIHQWKQCSALTGRSICCRCLWLSQCTQLCPGSNVH